MAQDDIPGMSAVGAVPAYADIKSYAPIWGHLRVWEGDGWQAESMSWKDGAYVAANLVGPIEYVFTGPDAQAFLSQISTNDVNTWPLGRSKHLVMLDEAGLIASHALAVRDADQVFRMIAGPPWPMYQLRRFDFDVATQVNEIFILQVAGPKSLDVLIALLGDSVRDLAFLDVVPVAIPGSDATFEMELSRIGMAGTLAYELRGPLEAGPAVYDAVYQAGKPLGIVRLGWRTYAVNHTEGGFPQLGVSWLPSMLFDPAVVGGSVARLLAAPLTGSANPADVRARLRTPVEVNWAWMAKFNHEFVGRAALEAEVASPKRKTVILRWNAEDVLDVFASQFERGDSYRVFEFPVTPQQPAGGHADIVTTCDGRHVGISSAVVYSYYYREMISQTVIDIDQSELGTEVLVHWGDFGGRIKQIRATVERFPYLELARNKDVDVSTKASTP